MPLRSDLLSHWRAGWLESAYPMVVEHDRDGIASMCAAPSLWMRARELQQDLRDLQASPGETLALALPPGVAWVQGLIAGLRFGARVWPEDTTNASLRFDGHTITRTHPAATPCPEDGGVWTNPDPTFWSEHTLLARALERPCDAETRVLCEGDWRRPEVLLDGVLMALCAGAELHVLQPGTPHAVLDLTASHPDLIISSLDETS